MGKRLRLLLVALVCFCAVGSSEGAERRQINLPDIDGYKTLKCDFHMHTVFSDGKVWPTVRVDEAWREGLDAISITDHIEYRPFERDVPGSHNRPYEIAVSRAKKRNILVVKGAEITRDTPPGHFNAIFVEDIEALDTPDLNDVMREAKRQGAFVFWNHPGWKPKKKGWFDIHTHLYENKWFGGIEVANHNTYYPEAHEWCMRKDLVMLGNSDLHEPAEETGVPGRRHRTMTLVFARERSVDALKEALVNGRTAVWYKSSLIGRREYLDAMFRACVRVGEPRRQGRDVWVELTNVSDLDIEIEKIGKQGPSGMVLAANVGTMVKARIDDGAEQVKLSYIVRNFLLGRDHGLPVTVTIDIKESKN